MSLIKNSVLILAAAMLIVGIIAFDVSGWYAGLAVAAIGIMSLVFSSNEKDNNGIS